MKSISQINKRYRQILIASLVSSGSLLPLIPALAQTTPPNGGQNSAAPGEIQNQATAEFIDSADGSTGTIVSDIVKVTVAEIAGISAAPSATLPVNNGAATPALPTLYPTSTVYFDFIVKNEGNDPTQLFIPAAPSVATVNGTAVVAGQLQVINYNTVSSTGVVTTTAVTTNNLVSTTTGAATGSLTGLPNGGSVPAGGYITVRVPITIPFGTPNLAPIVVTLGNTPTAPTVAASVNNMPYVASGITTPGTNDLFTQDNTTVSAVTGEINTTVPFNGEREASATQTASVIVPKVVISGRVWDDADNSANNLFTNTIPTGTESGAIVSPSPLYALLVDSTGKVIGTTTVINNGTNGATGTNGTYSFSGVDGYQNGLKVVLSSSNVPLNTIITAATPSLPTGWTPTSPLTYTPFNVGGDTAAELLTYAGKDFGIEQLPNTADVVQSGIANPPGGTKYPVPALVGSDTDPTTPTVLGAGSSFKIVNAPLATQGFLYYNTGTAASPVYTLVTDGYLITNYDPAKLTFDPVDGVVAMSFTYASVDPAGKVDPSPATAAMNFTATPVTFSGKVYNDRDGVTGGTSNNGIAIKANPAGLDVGTDSKFGTTQTAVNAVLVDAATGKALQASVVVAADGTYSFIDVPPSTNVKVVLSATAITAADITAAGTTGITPTAAAPAGWVATSPTTTATINTGLLPVTSITRDVDFGIRQKAKLVLLKRITKINGLTTNPNDNTVLTDSMSSADTFNNVGNWPASYVVGSVKAGVIKPGDKIEYTVYFLNNQGSDATGVKICDPIRGAQDFELGSIRLTLGAGSATTLPDTNTYAGAIPTDCNASGATSIGAANGGVRIPLPDPVSGAIGVGAPTTSYGKFSFTTTVKP